ncbi:MAG: hypothetical protein HWE26_18490 [Alteromonadaceae bacterium]|nr:hypothetical protein [Alteromonadaceae bacterium]
MSDDGCVIVVEINDHGLPIRFQRLVSNEGDLRDPHFCIDGDRLFLLAHQRRTPLLGKAKTYSWFSGDGLSWSAMHDPGPDNWWLWRATSFQGQHWGLAYHRPSEQLDLYAGNLRGKMHIAATNVLSKQKHGLGYPNESDCCFTENGELLAVVRRDADTFTAQFGRGKPPYQHWQWQSLGCYIGAPAMLSITENTVIIAGRHYNGKKLVTQLWQLTADTGEINELLTLPSGGDNSYPGMTKIGNQLFVAYYSSHIDNQSRMYLARLDLER